ncbi:hypothetical protein BGZ76_011393 [Entomortierella beljakovae]|nr:hypothetical protein BGZ76_011393 [Entomortierella beljakovae]
MDSTNKVRATTNRNENSIDQHEEHVACHPGSALPSTILDTVLPLRGLTEPNSSTIHTLSSLSIEQLSELENTLRHVKMTKIQQLNPSQEPTAMSQDAGLSRNVHSPIVRSIPRPIASSGTGMRQYMSVMNPGTPNNNNNVTIPPSIQIIDLIPWLKFQYKTRNEKKIITIRADVDSINNLQTIPLDFREANCLYPSADGPEHLYNGTRRNYECECNEQGWKLAYLNPVILCGKRGLLQQAVVNFRNATTEQKSRRAKRREKKDKEQRHFCENNSTCRSQEHWYHPHPGMAPLGTGTRIGPTRLYPQSHLNHWSPNTVTINNTQAAGPISWQPVLTSSLHHTTQRPETSDTIPNNGYNQHQLPVSSTEQLLQPSLANTQDPSSLGAPHSLPATILPISSSTFGNTNNFIEFDRYFKNQVQNIRIRCDIDGVNIDEIPIEVKRTNCVYPRSFIEKESEGLDGTTSPQSHRQWEPTSVRQAEESYLNEIGWKLCFINRSILEGKRQLLQQALDAYRRRFLPMSCHPRARVEPLLLTRRSSTSQGISLPPSNSRHSSLGKRYQKQKSIDPSFRIQGRYTTTSNDQPSDSEGIGNQENDNEGSAEGFTNASNMSSGEESSASSSSSSSSLASDGNFHSQMSLLTFQGSIRTYSLGSESGSARSRPRVRPTTTTRVIGPRTSSPLPLFPTGSFNAIKKHFVSRSSHPNQSQSHEEFRTPKRVRWNSSPEGASELYHEQSSVDEYNREEQDLSEVGSLHNDNHASGSDSEEIITEDLGQNAIDQEEDDESNYWMSRLQNSEYQEDHNFVSMTTEELIGALTSGYNSDIEDEDDEDDEYSYFL